MTILRLTPHYYFESTYWPGRFDPVGGMQVQITNLSRWLAQKGIYQDVLTTGFPGIPRVVYDGKDLNVHSVRFMTLPLKSKYNGTVMLDESWTIGVIKWILKNANARNYDLIHVHASGVVWPLLTGKYVRRLLGNIPLVLSIHCSRNFTYEPMNLLDRIIHPWVKTVEKKEIETSSKVILLTESNKEKYRSIFGCEHTKFIAISDCIAPCHLEHVPGECCKQVFTNLSVPSDKKIVLYVGRIAYEKGWDMFVRIAERFINRQDLFFVVCGSGPQKRDMEKAVKERNLNSRFLITGFISHKKVACLMANSHVLVMPSRHEEFGGTALEAIVAGLPVIASNVGGLAKIFTHKQNAMLIQPDDVAGFTNAVNDLITETPFRKRIIRNANNEVISRFLPEIVFPKYIDIYNEVMTRN